MNPATKTTGWSSGCPPSSKYTVYSFAISNQMFLDGSNGNIALRRCESAQYSQLTGLLTAHPHRWQYDTCGLIPQVYYYRDLPPVLMDLQGRRNAPF
jgi:hypothetical protein